MFLHFPSALQPQGERMALSIIYCRVSTPCDLTYYYYQPVFRGCRYYARRIHHIRPKTPPISGLKFIMAPVLHKPPNSFHAEAALPSSQQDYGLACPRIELRSWRYVGLLPRSSIAPQDPLRAPGIRIVFLGLLWEDGMFDSRFHFTVWKSSMEDTLRACSLAVNVR